jgi:hypothetical protein
MLFADIGLGGGDIAERLVEVARDGVTGATEIPAFIAAVFAVGFLIRWVHRRVGGAS